MFQFSYLGLYSGYNIVFWNTLLDFFIHREYGYVYFFPFLEESFKEDYHMD